MQFGTTIRNSYRTVLGTIWEDTFFQFLFFVIKKKTSSKANNTTFFRNYCFDFFSSIKTMALWKTSKNVLLKTSLFILTCLNRLYLFYKQKHLESHYTDILTSDLQSLFQRTQTQKSIEIRSEISYLKNRENLYFED